MADVGPKTIVGAGAVVTTPLPGGVIAAGVPARVVRQR
jgi:acetyltransferase-like isoleucine patch superfamily enzyme